MTVASAPRRASPKEWAGLAVLSLPTALLGMDLTVLYLALPTLSADLRPSSTQALWIMDAYGLLIAGFLITMGTLGDRIGRRRLLLIGAVAFGLVSLAAAYTTSAETLIAARAALGIAGATLMPSTLALISDMFADQRQRALAIGVWATMFASGMALGPVVGGILLNHFWWGSIFLVAVPVVLVLLVAAPLVLPEHRAPVSGPLDLPSVALSLAAMLTFVYAVKQLAAYGVDGTILGTLVLSVVLAVVFVRRQRALPSPLLDVGLFASRTFSAALGVLLVGLIGVGGIMFLVTQYLQLVKGLSPLAAGAWMGPPALMMFAAAMTAPMLARHIRPAYVLSGTLTLSVVGYALLGLVDGGDGLGLVVSGFALVYLGLGAIAALGTDLVVGAAPPAQAGSASAMSETVQDLGVAVGVAVLGSLSTAVYRSQITLPDTLSADQAGAVGDTLSAALTVRGQIPDDVARQAASAFTTGLNVAALLAGIGILTLAILAAVTLRHIAPIGENDSSEDESADNGRVARAAPATLDSLRE